MKIYMMSHVNVCSLTTYHILLVEFGELLMDLYALNLTMSFQQQLATYPPLGYLVKQPHFLNTLPNKDLKPGANRPPSGRHHGVYVIGNTTTTQKN